MTSRKSTSNVASHLNDAEAAILNVKTKLPPTHDSKAQKLYDKSQSESAGLIKEGAKELFSAVKSQLGNFIQSSDVLITILDELGGLHPWIKVAVCPFKAALTLELQRKNNDKRVLALFIQMNEMMEVLRLLEPIKPEELGAEGGALGSRMKDKLEAAAKSIQGCSHVTHEYYKMKFIPKLLKSFKWEDQFSDLASTFVKFSDDLKVTIEIYTGTGVQAIHRVVGRMDAKIDIMMKIIFEQFVSPEEQELSEFMKQKGGPQKFELDEKLLSELMIKRVSQVKRGHRKGAAFHADMDLDHKRISELQAEIKESLETTLEKSRGFFDEKFKEQENQIKELKVVIQREGDRIIEHIQAGAHENILDKVLYRIWVEMGWKGSAKARHVILAIRDFYIYQLHQSAPQEQPPSAIEAHSKQQQNTIDNRSMIQKLSEILPEVPPLRSEDRWVVDYISGFRLRCLIEALDPDCSGFINVNEINDFTSARPEKWSLLNWLAYWAVGFEVTVRQYCYKIRAVLSEIDASYQLLLPGNTQIFSFFLHSSSMQFVDRLVAGVYTLSHDGSVVDEYQHPSFEEFTKQNEQRTRKRLEKFSYLVDERSTLSLVIGSGPRLEEHIFPLVYLILKQIRRIVSEGSYRILQREDFYNVNVSLNTIWICAWDRIQVLQRVFKLRNIPVDDELRRYAYGLYYYIYTDEGLSDDPSSYFNLPDSHFDPPVELDDEEHSKGDSRRKSYEDNLDNLDVTPYNEPVTRSGTTSKLAGQWNGFYYYVNREDGVRSDGVMSFSIDVINEDGSFFGGGVDPLAKFSIAGKLGNLRLNFLKEYQQEIMGQRQPPWLYQGVIDNDSENMNGLWSAPPPDFDLMSMEPTDPHLTDPTEFHGTFVLSKKPVELIRFRPMELAFGGNKALTLWKFARDAILYKVSNGALRWSILAARRDTRHRFIELYREYKNYVVYFDSTPNPEYNEFHDLQNTMIPADLQFYKNLADATDGKTVYHCVYCDSCGRDVRVSTRYLCLECSKGYYYNSTTDICYHCISKSFTFSRGSKQLKHNPIHPIIQIRRPLVDRQLYSCRENAEMTSRGKLSEPDHDGFSGNIAQDHQVTCQTCKKEIHRPYWQCCRCHDYVICMECNQRDERGKPWLYERRPKPLDVYEDGPDTDYDTGLLWGEVTISQGLDSEAEREVSQAFEKVGGNQSDGELSQEGGETEESTVEEDNSHEDLATEDTKFEEDIEPNESVGLSSEEEEDAYPGSIRGHHWTHDLVLCTSPQAPLPVITFEDKVEQVGKSVTTLESRLVGMEEKVEQVGKAVTTLENRLARMEELLNRLVTQSHP